MTEPPVTLRSPAELLAVIPHVLGFEPENAIVVLALRDNKLGLTQRMDLPQADRTTEVANTLARHVLRDEGGAVLFVGYEDTPGESRFSECLCVIPEHTVKADLEFIATLTESTTFGQVRSNPLAWLEVTGHEHYDEDDELVDPATFAPQEPYDFHEWFGEDALIHVPLARLRTAQLCPTEVMNRYGRADDNVGFVDYQPAPWLSPEDRTDIEGRLSDLGWTVRAADALIVKYLDV